MGVAEFERFVRAVLAVPGADPGAPLSPVLLEALVGDPGGRRPMRAARAAGHRACSSVAAAACRGWDARRGWPCGPCAERLLFCPAPGGSLASRIARGRPMYAVGLPARVRHIMRRRVASPPETWAEIGREVPRLTRGTPPTRPLSQPLSRERLRQLFVAGVRAEIAARFRRFILTGEV